MHLLLWRQIAPSWLDCALAEPTSLPQERPLLASDEGRLGVDAVRFPRPFVEGVIARMAK